MLPLVTQHALRGRITPTACAHNPPRRLVRFTSVFVIDVKVEVIRGYHTVSPLSATEKPHKRNNAI